MARPLPPCSCCTPRPLTGPPSAAAASGCAPAASTGPHNCSTQPPSQATVEGSLQVVTTGWSTSEYGSAELVCQPERSQKRWMPELTLHRHRAGHASGHEDSGGGLGAGQGGTWVDCRLRAAPPGGACVISAAHTGTAYQPAHTQGVQLEGCCCTACRTSQHRHPAQRVLTWSGGTGRSRSG